MNVRVNGCLNDWIEFSNLTSLKIKIAYMIDSVSDGTVDRFVRFAMDAYLSDL